VLVGPLLPLDPPIEAKALDRSDDRDGDYRRDHCVCNCGFSRLVGDKSAEVSRHRGAMLNRIPKVGLPFLAKQPRPLDPTCEVDTTLMARWALQLVPYGAAPCAPTHSTHEQCLGKTYGVRRLLFLTPNASIGWHSHDTSVGSPRA
jgi:hypothetical protein